MDRNRVLIAVAGVLLLVSLSAFAYDRSRDDTVANGVSVGGIDVSGLSRTNAQIKLQRQLQDPLLTPIKVSYKGRTRTLTAGGAGVDVDINGMVDEAIDRGNSGFFVVNAAKSVLGVSRNVSVGTRITYSHAAVRNFINRMKRVFNQPAIDASVKFSPTGLGEVDGQTGVKIKTSRLRRSIVATFSTHEASRKIKLPVKITKPKVTRQQLAGKYPVAVTVDRSGFRLRLFKKLKLVKTYKIAVGKAGLETPSGLYNIRDKQIDPAWHVPNSDWAGKLAGKVIKPGDPRNPLKKRWMGIYNGVGIHGTSDISSLGTAASHGCIRMNPDDVVDLFPHVPVGASVYIG
ncbi:MAG TPA: L,D-transpeptidase family protein [Solirubrobacterales bacterium]|jgi:lipoprotein-anchoring transpeptidase ErfK/SrfK|nr:L,D-transpeptidase family protein [Solirubrobacterales bacterium]